MIKKLAALALGAVAAVGLGGVANAAEAVPGGDPVVVDGGETITVTVQCPPNLYGYDVTFDLEGSTDSGTCPFPEVTDQALEVSGIRLAAEVIDGAVVATLTAPLATATETTYTGTIDYSCDCDDRSPQGFRSAVQGFRGSPSAFVQGAQPPSTFLVTVRAQQVTTTTTTTTTLAPTTTAAATTVAPTTTAAAAIPPAPTTTVAITGVLPATGGDENNQAWIALGLVALGGGLVLATRYRRRSSAG